MHLKTSPLVSITFGSERLIMMSTSSMDNHPRKRFESVAANALCASACFGLCLFAAHTFFPHDPAVLLGLLATGNLVGWALGSFLYKRLDPAIWPFLFYSLARFVAVALVFAAGQFWNEYRNVGDLRKLSLITLCLSTAAASVRLTARSYWVATFSFLLAIPNVVMYSQTGNVLILGAAVFCVVLGAQALVPRPTAWHSQNSDDSAKSETSGTIRGARA